MKNKIAPGTSGAISTTYAHIGIFNSVLLKSFSPLRNLIKSYLVITITFSTIIISHILKFVNS
jgi:uncharacterized membrane protein